MGRTLRTARNLAAAALLALVGLGWGPADTGAQEIECIDSADCTACTDGQCIAACCGSCEEIIVLC